MAEQGILRENLGGMRSGTRIYANFDLLFETGIYEGYRVRVVGSPAGEATGTFLTPFTDAELDAFVDRIRSPGVRQRRLESGRHRAARLLGDALFQALFAEDIERCYRASLDEVERRGEGLRIRLRLSEVPELIDLPWELLHDPQTEAFLALSVWTPIVRYLESFPAFSKNGTDMDQIDLIFTLVPTVRPFSPGIISAGTDLQKIAKVLNGHVRLLRINEPEFH